MGGDQSRLAADDAPVEVALHEYEDQKMMRQRSKPYMDQSSSEKKGSKREPQRGQSDPESLRNGIQKTTGKDLDYIEEIVAGTSEGVKMGNTVFKVFNCACDGDNVSVKEAHVLEQMPDLDKSVGGTPAHCCSCLSGTSTVIMYLSAFAIIGSSMRVYLGRIFGYDCEFPPEEGDYISPLSTCLTSTGLTALGGGALFIDLPANMFGSLLMGIMTPVDDDVPALPWLKSDHRLQKFKAIHLSISVALCGSLTTFASWNTQMVQLLVGKESAFGSPQVVQAIFGYLIGVICAVGCFHFGRHIGKGMHYLQRSAGDLESKGDISDDTEGESESRSSGSSRGVIFPKLRRRRSAAGGSKQCFLFKFILDFFDILLHGKYSPFIFVTLLFTLFFVGDFKMDSSFHKKMWVAALFSPLGTILRWRLSVLNGTWFRDKDILRCFPFGTFSANILGSAISITCAAVAYRLNEESTTAALVLHGIKSGFAGNLSTVSTFAKEIVLLSEKNDIFPAYIYATTSVLICCIVGVVIYLPIIYS